MRRAFAAVWAVVLILALTVAPAAASTAQAASLPAPSASSPAPSASSPQADSSHLAAGTPSEEPVPEQEEASAHPVVLLGFAGLTFEDLDPNRTPNLWRLIDESAVGSLTPRSVRDTSCAADGWLALSSGRRAADEPRPTCRVLQEPIGGWVPDWDVYLDQAAEDNYTPSVGTLTETAEKAGARITGIGPGAAIGTAQPDGRTQDWQPLRESGELGEQVTSASGTADIVLVDLGSVYSPGQSVAGIDAAVGEVLAATDELPAGQAPTLIAASIADARTDDSRMQFAAVRGGVGAGGPMGGEGTSQLLTSSSTRQPGLLQVTDLTPTLLASAGVTGAGGFAGAPLSFVDGPADAASKQQRMLDRQTAVLTQENVSAWFYAAWGILLTGLLVTCTVIVKRRGLRRAANIMRVGGLLGAALPISTFLVNVLPWERWPSADVAMLGGVTGWAIVLTALGLLGPWRRLPAGPLGFIAATTVGVLAVDVSTGSSLQMSTLLGEPLLIASRFYGIGNSALALYCTALLVGLGVVCSWMRRRWSITAVVAVAVLASCVLLATPGLGTKFGSVPTLLLGTAVFAVTAAGVTMSWKRLLLIGGGGAAGLMLLVLFLDWLRPTDQRTHFGNFFDSILTGEAGAVLLRKIGMNIDILTQSWATVLLPFVLAAILWAAISPDRFRIPLLGEWYRDMPLLRTSIISLAVLLTVGTFINDSGIVVPAVGILFLMPALTHLVGTKAKDQPKAQAQGQAQPQPGAQAQSQAHPRPGTPPQP
ncbi:hypothetical protein [Brevibacterium yomogidense]|uniref:Phosphoglyceromutase n=1 Tax=Brevibacterium yomogidense TaxID=946573 RepID=A0A1X6X619_9MICO|nr:hypothetical protein [Brevibacterium yomogidense]SLM94615.1 Phosphoglyceromutase [Brevibacterium yomogidense]